MQPNDHDSPRGSRMNTHSAWIPIAIVMLLLSNGSHTQTLLPPPFSPSHPVRLEKSVMVPMRDGIKLSTDLYIPQNVTGSLPAIMVRTPYNKSNPAFWNFYALQSVSYNFPS